MAHANSTLMPVNQASTSFAAAQVNPAQLEKISCSVRGKDAVHPLNLMGKRIRIAEMVLAEATLFEPFVYQSSIVDCTVLAVCLGSTQHGIPTSLLLVDDDCSDPYYSEIDKFVLLDVYQ